MRKGMKRFLSIMLALVMVVALTATVKTEVKAANETCTITISGTDGAEYSAYKLMDLTVSGTNYSYTENSKYSSVLSSVLTSLNVHSDAVTYLGTLTSNPSDMRTFADAVYKAIVADATLSADYTSTSSTMTVAYGYYLIVETSTSGTADTYSLVMLDTADKSAVTVTTKESTPTMTKQVVDVNDSTDSTAITDPTSSTITWQDTADYDVEDAVWFKLVGTVSDYYANYSTYYYVFHDDMCDGLSFNSDSVKVYVLNNSTYTLIDSQYYTVKTKTNNSLTDGCDFEVVFENLKNVSAVTSTSSIIVYYTATLTGNSVVYGNPGNPNEAYLEYSNNPYSTGTGDTAKTPKDGVVIFTYVLEITKTDESGNALNGATFELKKYDATSSSWKMVKTIEGTSGNVFTFSGLDDGYYRIEETKVPDGYNGIDPIYFTISASHKSTTTSWANSTDLTELKTEDLPSRVTLVSGDNSTGNLGTVTNALQGGKLSTAVKNTSGQLLPATGGIGTTILYIIGAILVVGAGVLLVTRRRVAR